MLYGVLLCEKRIKREAVLYGVLFCGVVWCGVCGCVSKLRYQGKYVRMSPSPLRLPFPKKTRERLFARLFALSEPTFALVANGLARAPFIAAYRLEN